MNIETAATTQIIKGLDAAFGSPAREVGNYIADKIKYLRYKSLLKIVKRATEKAKQEGLLLEMPPIKFFVPFCEAASLETESDIDNGDHESLHEMWASLLVSASDKWDSRHVFFTRVLSEITSNEVALLRRLVQGDNWKIAAPASWWAIEDAHFEVSDVLSILREIDHINDDQEVADLLSKCLECPGVTIEVINISRGEPFVNNEDTSYIFDSEWYWNIKTRASVQILLGLGLARQVTIPETKLIGGQDRTVRAEAIMLSELGVSFVHICSDIRELGYARPKLSDYLRESSAAQ